MSGAKKSNQAMQAYLFMKLWNAVHWMKVTSWNWKIMLKAREWFILTLSRAAERLKNGSSSLQIGSGECNNYPLGAHCYFWKPILSTEWILLKSSKDIAFDKQDSSCTLHWLIYTPHPFIWCVMVLWHTAHSSWQGFWLLIIPWTTMCLRVAVRAF
jgi:hypothetical protein